MSDQLTNGELKFVNGEKKTMKIEGDKPVVMVIGGFDGSSGAGVTADLRMIESLGGYGVAVLAALTIQDHLAFDRSVSLDSDLIGRQIEWLLGHYSVRAVKVGMLSDFDAVVAVVNALEEYCHIPLVVDPVLRSSSGGRLLDDRGFDHMCQFLLPRATLITPNLLEARLLLASKEAMSMGEDLALALQKRFAVAVLLKGGHADGNVARDLLVDEKGRVSFFDGPRVSGVCGHGTGCRLASAIAVKLALGHDLHSAVAGAKEAQNQLFSRPISLEGYGPVLQ